MATNESIRQVKYSLRFVASRSNSEFFVQKDKIIEKIALQNGTGSQKAA